MGGLFSVWIRYHTMMGFYFVMLLVVLKFVLQHFGASFHIHYFQVVMGVSYKNICETNSDMFVFLPFGCRISCLGGNLMFK